MFGVTPVWGLVKMLEQKGGSIMREDAFSTYHPCVNFIFFLSVISFGALLQHPVYLGAGVVASATYYSILYGQKGWKTICGMIPLFLFLVGINPLINTRGVTVLFELFERPYTLEAVYYGITIASIFVEMILWLGCYNKVLTSDKFSCLFANVMPSMSLLLTMIFRMIPNLIAKAKQISGTRSAIQKQNDKITDSLIVLEVLIAWALEGGVITADAMRARGYGSGKRSSFMMYQMKKRDWVMLVVMIGILFLIIVFFAMGAMEAVFVPELRITPIVGYNRIGFWGYCCYIMIPSVLYLKEVIQWSILKYKI